MHVLSIQSSVAYGHVGNSAATFPLQRIGIEVSAVSTVHFSNHAGYGSWRGPVLTAADIRDVLAGIEERGVFGSVDALLTGYLGDPAVGPVILDAVDAVRRANPRAVYCLDPVMGDTETGVYVRTGVPELLRDRLLPAADLVTPNHFELEYLTGRSVTTVQDALDAARQLRARGPSLVLVTSLVVASGEGIHVLAAADEDAYLLSTPRLPLHVDGSGDMAAALFLAHWLRTGDARAALQRSMNTVYAVLEETQRLGAVELELIAAQDLIAQPPDRFAAAPL